VRKIDSNNIGTEGAKALGKALKENRALTILNICLFFIFNMKKIIMTLKMKGVLKFQKV